MKITALKFLLFSIVLSSCGQSAEQNAAQEKRFLDSINASKDQELLNEKRRLDSASAAGQQQILEQQQAMQTEASESSEQYYLKQQIIDLTSKLAAEEERLSDLKQPKFLRSANEKADQIEYQTRIVEELRSEIADLEKQIVN